MSLRERLHVDRDPLYLMDGSAFIFRSFYAYQNMARSDGFPTNVLFILTRLLIKLLREEQPVSFAFIMDGKGPTFRHELYQAYKAQRSATPEPLVMQLEPLRRALSALGLPVIVSDGCEADDCIASLTARYRRERPVVIIGADKDLKQCLAENVVIWDPSGKEEKLLTIADFRAENGMEPASWPDFQALIGDSSDNIPGVPGIGPKTAQELFRNFKTLEEIRDRFAAVPPKIRKKLEGRLDEAFLYRKLTTLSLNACAALPPESLILHPVDMAAATAVLEEFELRSLARELASAARSGLIRTASPGAAAPEARRGCIADGQEPNLPAAEAPEPPAAYRTASAAATAEEEQIPSPPATVPWVPARLANSKGQASLLDIAFEPGEDDLPAVSSIPSLPPLETPAVAVLPTEKGLILGAASECLFTGPPEQLAGHLALLLEARQDLRLVTPDLKALYAACRGWKAIPVARFFDLSLAAYLLNPEDRSYAWPHLVSRWRDQVPDDIPPSRPGLLALALARLFEERLGAAQQSTLMRDLEMPLLPVLADMEEAGVRIDRQAFASFLAEVQTDIERLEKTINDLAGGPFNIRSSQQLAEVLFTRLALPAGGKTKGGSASTSQEVLEKLAGKHAIVDAILEYRKLEKLRSTYLEPLPKLADRNDRIHTTFNLLATATGRLSSSNPNLQNIPVRGPMGGRMRACFIAAPGKKLVSADYSQVELRILAHLAHEPILIEAFQNGEDIHSRTAALLFDTSSESVTPEQRRQAKTINFGLIYGMGPQKLGQELGISLSEAKGFIARYFEHLTALRDFYNAVENEAREHGYVTTMAGRRRYIPDISSQNTQLRSQARRQAINAGVQGCAADVIKIAMLRCFNDPELKRLYARMILQIHDELILEAPAQNAERAGERLTELMRSVEPGGEKLTVPLAVDWGCGKNWNEAH